MAKWTKYNRTYWVTPKGRATKLLCGIKNNCKRRGVVFSISLADVLPQFEAGICSVTGIPFVFDSPVHQSPFAPSLDRIDPSIGYIPENVRVVIYAYNTAKGIGTDDDVLRMARALLKTK